MTITIRNQVLQDWVMGLPLMQQSVLLSGIRGPDTLRKDHPAKMLMRWYRRAFLVCAFDQVVHFSSTEPCGGSFTGRVPDVSVVGAEYLHNVDEVPHHFHLHLMHGAQIIGHHCPYPVARDFWRHFYLLAVKDMHLEPESLVEMDERLSDNEDAWKRRENFPARA
jgi:hypothetical protein